MELNGEILRLLAQLGGDCAAMGDDAETLLAPLDTIERAALLGLLTLLAAGGRQRQLPQAQGRYERQQNGDVRCLECEVACLLKPGADGLEGYRCTLGKRLAEQLA